MLYRRELNGLHKEAARLIDAAARGGITLDIRDFGISGGQLTLDGMPADQWVEALTDERVEGDAPESVPWV